MYCTIINKHSVVVVVVLVVLVVLVVAVVWWSEGEIVS